MTQSELMAEEEEMENELVEYDKLLAQYVTSARRVFGLHNQCCKNPRFLLNSFCLPKYI